MAFKIPSNYSELMRRKKEAERKSAEKQIAAAPTKDRRARLHDALDCAIDRARAKDGVLGGFTSQKSTSYKGFVLSYASQHEPVVVKKDGKKVYTAKNLEAAKVYCTEHAY